MNLLEPSILETVVEYNRSLLSCGAFNARIGNLNLCNDVNLHNMKEIMLEEFRKSHHHVINTLADSIFVN